MRSQLFDAASIVRRVLLLAGLAILVTPLITAQDETPSGPISPARPMPPSQMGPPAPMNGIRRPMTPPGVVRPQAAAEAAPSAPATPPIETYRPAALSAEVSGDAEAKAPELKFDNADADGIVLQAYARETGRTLLISPDAPKAKITLRSQTTLNRREYLQAIQTVLRMNGIALLPLGDKFLKVVPASAVLANAIDNRLDLPANGQYDDMGQLVSQMIELHYITLDEASKALTPFKRGEGQIQIFERTNSLLITDRAENVNRMLEIIRFLDKKHETLENVYPIQIRYAKAATIKQRLDEIVAESQKTATGKPTPQANASGSPGMRSVAAPLPVPGVVRAPTAGQPAINNPIIESFMDEAERGVIRGKVQILADERSNKLIFMTLPQNMIFFNRIIDVLDIPTSPDVDVMVYRLEYADAEDVAKMINDLIGNSKPDQSKAAPGAAASAGTGAYGSMPGGEGAAGRTAENLAAYAARLAQPATAPAAATGEAGKSKVGELSKDNIKILSNKRTNAVIIMASDSDMQALLKIIKDMDIQLAQVLIETVVLDVTLTEGLSTGIDWIQNSMFATRKLGGITYAGGGGGGTGVATPISAVTNLAFTGAQYFFSIPDLNVNAVIQASSTDGRTKILTSPVLLTQDNKDATIEATQLRYLFKGYTTSGYNANGTPVTQANVDQRNVGLTVKVTPRINPTGMVALKVDETYEDIGPDQTIDGQAWPTTQTRKLSADIAVKSGETVILGGLVRNEKTSSNSKVPLLGDIPFIGRYLFGSTSDSDTRSELLIFLTPYVQNTPEEGAAEARRRKDYLDVKGMWTKGWSNSKLADETVVQKINREKEEHAAERARERDARNNPAQAPAEIHDMGIMSVSVTTNLMTHTTNENK